jgi:signal peptidase II
LDFHLTFNTGAAWGMLDGARAYFVIIAVVCTLAVLFYLLFAREVPRLVVVAFGFFVGGSIGNAIDRALSGEVVDFIHTLFIDFPIFNLADSALTVGVILLLLTALLSIVHPKRDGGDEADADADEDPDAETDTDPAPAPASEIDADD